MWYAAGVAAAATRTEHKLECSEGQIPLEMFYGSGRVEGPEEGLHSRLPR